MNTENLLEEAKYYFGKEFTSADRDEIAGQYEYSEKELDVVIALLKAMEYGFRSGIVSADEAKSF